ncbi:HK97 gp10 family phage protein [Sedimentibacter hydroxybenzoicus DSM 7310]|uniref:HK97 gp10 family phage protein n=1 Tax=Sedimentibacter hydroxybenzoicus DSM 7310 TaxID=1123245 RepID=A0A974BIG6_SEDHY|nr:HK97-gp10 family putative phage morphogenesis protein [Sedimentibacter hydroxybenzoicus]NYB73397.1 HK97 gp10 family phage protein [Sedimentibacter hydroxybenzoicus DSM 7310]
MAGEVYLNIKEVVDKLLPEALQQGLEAVGQLIENEAKANCPHDDGQLRASITHQVSDELDKVSIGSNLEYAPYIHQGTGLYAAEGDGRKEVPWRYQDAKGEWHTTKGQKPQPFLRDAIDKNMDKLTKPFENLLNRQNKGD